MYIEWPAIIAGVGMIVVGVLGIRFRVVIARQTAEAQTLDALRRSSTPGVVLAVGVFFAFLGAVAIIAGLQRF
jgi:uncharacterized membrane protein YbhN (UPF0104 family)